MKIKFILLHKTLNSLNPRASRQLSNPEGEMGSISPFKYECQVESSDLTDTASHAGAARPWAPVTVGQDSARLFGTGNWHRDCDVP